MYEHEDILDKMIDIVGIFERGNINNDIFSYSKTSEEYLESADIDTQTLINNYYDLIYYIYDLEKSLLLYYRFSTKKINFNNSNNESPNIKTSLLDNIEELCAYITHDKDFQFDLIVEKNKVISTKCYVYILLLFSYYTQENKIDSIDDFEHRINLLKNNFDVKVEDTFFRGHSNSKYNIIPSIYRNSDLFSGYKDILINEDTIYKLYDKTKLIDKYNYIYSHSDTFVMDYNFLTMMQHSCSFSPLLDFTEEERIARVFATHDDNISTYTTTNFSIIWLHISHRNNNNNKEIPLSGNALENLNISMSKSRLSFKSTIFGKPIYLASCKDFAAEFLYQRKKTNDRMKYQKGVFIMPVKAIIVNGKLLNFPINYLFYEFVFDKSLKESAYLDAIKNHPYFKYEYLMSPYDYFKDNNN